MHLPSLHWFPPSRVRQLRRCFRDLKLTIICGFLTILVLRGILGAGKFGTPLQDFEDIKQLARAHVLHRKQLASRAVLEELVTQNARQNVEIVRDSNRVDVDHKYADEEEAGIDAELPEILISDSGTQRSNSSKLGSVLNQSGQLKIMLFLSGSQPSFCNDDPIKDRQLLLKSMKNKIDYCRLHGMEMFYADMAPVEDPTAAKKPSVIIERQEAILMREMMVKHPEVEWIWWMNRDTMVTDMEYEVRMEKYEGYKIVVYGSMEEGKGFHESFWMKNCGWSRELLKAWEDSYSKEEAMDSYSKEEEEEEGHGFRHEEEEEEGHGLRHEEEEEEEGHGFRHEEEEEEESHGFRHPEKLQTNLFLHFVSKQIKLHRLKTDQIYIETSPSVLQVYGLPPFSASTQNISLQNESDSWPFLTHFSGNCTLPCHLLFPPQIHPQNPSLPCSQQMHRAFNLADNQVLQLYGFHHNSLSSDRVSRLVREDHTHLKQSFL